MDIETISWNFFHIPITKNEKETKEDYFERIYKGMVNFYKEFTKHPDSIQKTIINYWGPPLAFEMEHNFCDMHLEGITFCDVKYFVGDSGNRKGIDVCCHRDEKNRRQPMIDFIKNKWEEFDYKF